MSATEGRVPSPYGPLRGGYLASNPLLLARLALGDALLRSRNRDSARSTSPVSDPRRVLVAIGGHLGDAVIASAALRRVREEWPEAEIGVVGGGWLKPVLGDHPVVSRWHVMDHWKLNRGERSALRRMRRYVETRKCALAEIVAMRYDVAIDLYPYYPNSIPLLAEAGIPVRVGFTTGGGGPLLTHPVEWGSGEQHLAEIHGRLIEALTGRPPAVAPRYDLPDLGGAAEAPTEGLRPGGYLLLHIGAGLAHKEWPVERWRVLVARLLAEGHRLVFTGNGREQKEKIRAVLEGQQPGWADLCGAQSWPEFVATVAGARLVVTVDSVAGHLAAASGTPVVVLMTGMNPIEQWRPLAERVSVVTAPVACAPCHRSRGCEEMTCIRGVSVASVLARVHEQLDPEPMGGDSDPSLSGDEATTPV